MTENHKVRQVAKSSFLIGIGSMSKKAFALVSNLVLARLLLPEDFGVISIAYIFWSFFVLFLESSTSLFILYKGISDIRYVETTFTISILNGIGVAIALCSISPIVSNFFDIPELEWLLRFYAANLFISSLYFVYAAVLLRQNKHFAFTINILISSVVRLSVTVIAALLGMRYWAFAIGDFAYWTLVLGLSLYQSKLLIRLKLHWSIAKEAIQYCSSVIFTSLGFYVNSNLDNFTVGKILGKSSLGYYNLAYQLSMSVVSIVNPIMNQVAMPSFADITSPEKQKITLAKVVQEIFTVILPLYCMVYLCLNPAVVVYFFGEEWLPILSVFPWLMAASYFRVLNAPLKVMLAAQGLPSVNAIVNLSIAPLALLGFFIGARSGSIVNVSIAAFLVLGLLWSTIWWILGCRKLGWSIRSIFSSSLKPIVIVLSCFLPSAFLYGNWVSVLLFFILYATGVRIFLPNVFFKYLSYFKLIIQVPSKTKL